MSVVPMVSVMRRKADEESRLHGETDLRLVVLVDVARRIVELGAAHVDRAVDEHAVPRHLYVLEVHDASFSSKRAEIGLS